MDVFPLTACWYGGSPSKAFHNGRVAGYGTVLFGSALHGTMLHGTVLHYTVLHCTVLHGTLLHGTLLHGTVLLMRQMHRIPFP